MPELIEGDWATPRISCFLAGHCPVQHTAVLLEPDIFGCPTFTVDLVRTSRMSAFLTFFKIYESALKITTSTGERDAVVDVDYHCQDSVVDVDVD